MQDNESIFKEKILHHLDAQLRSVGYQKEEDYKGFVKYMNQNNYLKLIYEWNRSHEYYCRLGFKSDYPNEYFLTTVIAKIDGLSERQEVSHGGKFIDKIEEWVHKVSSRIIKYNIHELQDTDQVVIELNEEQKSRNKQYNDDLLISQTKREADKYWAEKDFKSFIAVIENKQVELPGSYKKKLEIAKKKVNKDKA
jgi:hypothetical protein